ncbi:MAG TPA: TauD/TfdA family dioxygenase [Mycobacteriales bacterium]
MSGLAVTVPPGRPATVAGSGPGWLAAHAEDVAAAVLEHGALLVTGLAVGSAADLGAARDALGLTPAAWHEQFAQRRELAAGVWSAPEWAADREQCLHHDEAYGVDFPRLLLMTCLTPAASGGDLLLGDTRAALRALPAALADRFRAEGWVLHRTFRPHFGLPWSAAFGTDDPTAVEKTCADRLIGCSWADGGVLHTGRRRSAVVRHPVTGAECWFNDVAFFSRWSVPAEERELLLGAFGDGGLPFDTRFGDGGEIDEPSWRAVLDGYDAVLRRVRWQPGDLLLLDNVLTAHGRAPFTGPWEVAVAPADPVPLAACRPTVPPAPVP